MRIAILSLALAGLLGGCAGSLDSTYGYRASQRERDVWGPGPVDTRKLFDVLESRMPLGGPESN